MEISKFKDFENFTIFCDMDGVLTNFHKRFREIESNVDNLNPDEYNEVNGKLSMWDIINEEGLEWWSEMEWMEDGEDLWDHINKYNHVKICSAPSRHENSSKGKMIWINRELGIEQDTYTRSPKFTKWEENSEIILNSQKYMFNGRFPNSILIDDTPKQVNNWIKNGGIAILHVSTEQTIKELDEILRSL